VEASRRSGRTVHPGDRRVVTLFLHRVTRAAGDGIVRVVVYLRAGTIGHPLVQQPDQRADDPGLGLAPLAQQDDVVARQVGVLQLGHHGVLEPEHAGHQGPAERR